MTSQLTPTAATKGEAVLLAREFDAPRDRVFHTWTDPEEVKRWWGPKGFTSPTCSIDLRPGGVFFACMRSPDGDDFWSVGEYRKVVTPERLVYTDAFADENGNPVPASHYGMGDDWPDKTLVTVTFVEERGKTRLTLRHEGIPADVLEMCAQGWNESLDKFAEALTRPSVVSPIVLCHSLAVHRRCLRCSALEGAASPAASRLGTTAPRRALWSQDFGDSESAIPRKGRFMMSSTQTVQFAAPVSLTTVRVGRAIGALAAVFLLVDSLIKVLMLAPPSRERLCSGIPRVPCSRSV